MGGQGSKLRNCLGRIMLLILDSKVCSLLQDVGFSVECWWHVIFSLSGAMMWQFGGLLHCFRRRSSVYSFGLLEPRLFE